jgi:hypothetical protein
MEFESLPPGERAARYRRKANEQVALASGADTPDIRATCLELAAMWMRLAEAAQHGEAAAESRRDTSGERKDRASA